MNAGRDIELYLCILLFFFLALSNLLLFSLYEREIDEADGHTSFVRALGGKASQRIIAFLCSAVIAGSVYIFANRPFSRYAAAAAAYIVMSGIFLALLVFPGYFRYRERYRIYGDAAFFIPILPVLFWPGL